MTTLCLGALLCLTLAPEVGGVGGLGSPQSRAVLIFVSGYPDGISDLQGTPRDAGLFGAAMQVPPRNITLLGDLEMGARTLPTKRNIEAAIEALARSAGPDDTLWVFFSGHGVYYQGTSYLVPRISSADEALVGHNLVSTRWIRETLSNPNVTKSKRAVLVLDACQSGSTRAFGAGQDSLDALLGATKTVSTMAAAKPNQSAWEFKSVAGSGYHGGVFTYFLVDGLLGAARAQRGGVTFESLAEYVTRQVQAEVRRRTGEEQTPVFVRSEVEASVQAPLVTLAPPQTSAGEAQPSRHQLPSLDELTLTDVTPFPGGIVVSVHEVVQAGDGKTSRREHLRTALRGELVRMGYPVSAKVLPAKEAGLESAIPGQGLPGLSETVVAKVTQDRNSVYLLRANVSTTLAPSPLDTRFLQASTQVDFELVEDTGMVLAADSFAVTGIGGNDALAIQSAGRQAVRRIVSEAHSALESARK